MRTVTDMEEEIGMLGDKLLAAKNNYRGTDSERRYAESLCEEIDKLDWELKSRHAKPLGGRKPIHDDGFERVGSRPQAQQGRHFKSFGEQFQCIVKAGREGSQVDQRLYSVNSDFQAAAGLSETVPADGGFLLEETFSDALLRVVFVAGKLFQRTTQFPITRGNVLKLPAFDEASRSTGSRLGGVRGYWLNEGGTKTASAPKFRQMEIPLLKLIGLCYATDELLQDAVLLDRVLRSGFTSELKFLLDDAILNGSGVGQPQGILVSPSLVTVEKETSQTAATVVSANIIKMYSRLLDDGLDGSIWIINKSVLPQLMQMSVSVGTAGGSLIWMPANSLEGRPYQTLMGLPVIICEQSAALGTVGDIVLASMSHYIMATKPQIEIMTSSHVRFVQDETAYRFVFRCNGQSELAVPVTPFKGSESQSYFVTLATRA